MIRRLFTSIMLGIALLAGCHGGSKSESHTGVNSAVKAYKLRGKVLATNAQTGEVTVAHDAIPGFMGAMTMPYKLKDVNILSELHAGELITADLMVSQDENADVLLDHIVVIGESQPDYRPKVTYHVPAPGDVVPNFTMRNQDGKTISLDQFRGSDLLITFIYTRCPLPNFCPRVTHNFADINRQLQSDPAVYRKTHLLCVSFDPENDTPQRLRAYGAEYIGSDAKSAFKNWDFAVPQQQVLDKMAFYFDIGITHDAEDAITHTLSTTLIGADGKVVQFYPGNEWTVGQVLEDIKRTDSAG